MGKGSSPRPYSVDKETFDKNWDAIFHKTSTEPVKSDTIQHTKIDDQDLQDTLDDFKVNKE